VFDTYTEPDPNAPREQDQDKARFYPKNLLGHCVLIWVNEHVQEVAGSVSDNPDGIDVTVVDLGLWGDTSNDWGYVGVNMIWQANSLIGKLKDRIGKTTPICVYMGKGQAAQRGWQPPFTLADVSSDPLTRQKAEMWMQANPGFVPNVRQRTRGDQPGQHAPAPTPGPSAQSNPPGFAGPPQASQPPAGPIRSEPPYPQPGGYPLPPGSPPGPSSAPPNGGPAAPPYAPSPAPGGGQQGWTGSPAQPAYPQGPAGYPQSQPQPSTPSVTQPQLAYGDATPQEPSSIGVDHLARAHEPGRNAILDSLRSKHGIAPQDENPPF
jgi:hypothetical protein